MKVALLQTNSQDDKSENLRQVERLFREAVAAERPDMVVLPEVFSYIGGRRETREAAAEVFPNGPAYGLLASLAADHKVFVHGGSMFERDNERLYNTTVAFDRSGAEIARYRKIHLFDIEIAGQVSYQESALIAPGDEVVTVDLGGVTLGLAICYDLRFPELFRLLALQGAEIIAMPAAFTQFTGKDHWEVLLRARAIENQVFMVAPGEWGKHPGGSVTWGRSTIIDPWGTVLATAPDGTGVIVAECNLNTLERIRREVPSLANRRPAAYRWADEAVGVR